MSDLDLPAPTAPAPFADLPSAPKRVAAPFADLPSAPAPFADLPSAPSDFDDLPMPASPLPARAAAPASLDLDLDLPSSVAPKSAAGRPSSSGLDLDLPMLGARSSSGVGLPSVSPRPANAPSGASASGASVQQAEAGTKQAPRSPFGEVGLPTVSAGLPEVSRTAASGRGSVELPSLGRARVSSPGFELDDGLPLVGANLPTLSGVGLPERREAGLPALGASLPVYQSSGLPSPSTSGLPAAGGAGLPSTPPSYGALDLDIERAPSLPPDFGLDPLPNPNVRASRSDFGELELPLRGAPSLPPPRGAFSAEGEEADLFGDVAPRLPVAQAAPVRPAAEAVVRQSGGGTAYGEVNLGDDSEEAEVPLEAGPRATHRDEDMEFGAIPQEDQPRATARAAAGPKAVATPVGRDAPLAPKPKRKLDLRIYGGVFVVFVAGAALALVPSVGPFGAYLVIDQVKAGEYSKLVEDTVKQAQRAMARDSYPEAKQAIVAVEASRASAKRVRELPAYAAFSAFAEELRFGPDSAIHARGAVLLDELAEHPETRYVALARCARAAAEGQIARANQLFEGLP
ncbi:MAG TPA: hypothetical protein VEQ59_25450, partial [Polyangiaceae bacterium]|nr:hypothetical protein [Polyangiaceae bacterium]